MRRLAVLIALVACSREPKSKPQELPAKYQAVMDKYNIQVLDGPMPEDAEFMCSADYKVHPHSELHVIPTYNADLGNYVGSYRCNADYKQAIAETRAHFHANPTPDEGGAILDVFIKRGVTEDQLRAIVAGKALPEAIDAALDALESGKLALQP